MENEQKSDSKKPYWTVERIDEIIARLKSKYPSDAEDTEEVCALFQFRRVLAILRVRGG